MNRVFSFGNKKLPKHTAIFNMSPASQCVADKLGKCQLIDSKRCYAMKAERLYPQVLPYRKKQKRYWKDVSAVNFVRRLLKEKGRRKLKYLRFNEAGDFIDQGCVDKAAEIARLLKDHGIRCYMYTARNDLDFSNRGDLVINGSGFMVDNSFTTVYTKGKLKEPYCIQDCSKCIMCTKKLNLEIKVNLH